MISKISTLSLISEISAGREGWKYSTGPLSAQDTLISMLVEKRRAARESRPDINAEYLQDPLYANTPRVKSFVDNLKTYFGIETNQMKMAKRIEADNMKVAQISLHYLLSAQEVKEECKQHIMGISSTFPAIPLELDIFRRGHARSAALMPLAAGCPTIECTQKVFDAIEACAIDKYDTYYTKIKVQIRFEDLLFGLTGFHETIQWITDSEKEGKPERGREKNQRGESERERGREININD